MITPVFGVHVFLSLVCLKLLKFHRHLIYIDRFLSFPIFFRISTFLVNSSVSRGGKEE